MNTSIEQKYLIGFGGISWERLTEYVDQNDKVGRNQGRIFAEMPVENQSEKYLFITVWSVHTSLWSLEYILVFLISQPSADSSPPTFEAIRCL